MKLTLRDRQLRRDYEISEVEYNKQLAKQGGVCMCGQPPVNRALHVDHDHAIENWKVNSRKRGKGVWYAWPENGHGLLDFYELNSTKSLAIRAVKKRLKRLSVRGIVCWHCNSLLKKAQDNPVKLRKASEYLDVYYDHINNGNSDYFGK